MNQLALNIADFSLRARVITLATKSPSQVRRQKRKAAHRVDCKAIDPVRREALALGRHTIFVRHERLDTLAGIHPLKMFQCIPRVANQILRTHVTETDKRVPIQTHLARGAV
jgi:hypothetical protein